MRLLPNGWECDIIRYWGGYMQNKCTLLLDKVNFSLFSEVKSARFWSHKITLRIRCSDTALVFT